MYRSGGTVARNAIIDCNVRGRLAIDQIYEAAFVPERWSDVLDSLGALSNSASAEMLMFGKDSPPRGIASHSLSALFDQVLRANDFTTSVRIQRMLKLQPAAFVLVDEFVSREESDVDPMWSFFRSQGRRCQLCTTITMPRGEVLFVMTERNKGDGRYRPNEIDALNELRPHIARAGMVSERLSLERAARAVDTIEQLGLPAAVLTGGGRLCAANDLFANLSPAVVALHTGEVMLRDVRSARLFHAGLDELCGGTGSAVHSIPVRAGNRHGPLVLHLLPLHGVASNFFGEAEVLLVATAPVTVPAPSADLLNGLFDLSPAETRLVRHLARGTTVSEVASATGVSVATLRTQLSSIFAKTGTTRQAELLTLVAAIWTPLSNLVATNS